MSETPRHGLGDPRIPWVVLLDVSTAASPLPDDLADRLGGLAARHGWSDDEIAPVRTGERRALLADLAADGSPVLAAGIHPGGFVLAARHDALDGLALLACAGRLLGTPLHSTARGVGGERPAGGLGALAGRAWEVGARPPAKVAAPAPSGCPGDAFADLTVDGAPRTADLVLAAARAVAAWNTEQRRPARRISVAIGVSTLGGGTSTLGDNSGYLRLRAVERMTVDQVAAALRSAPLQPGGGAGSSGALARVAGVAVRLAAPRLGSTVLVSHLGAVDTDVPLAFYPVTGGASGLSIGAATVGGRTCITARARASRYADEELEHLLELLVANF